jgi:integrase
LAASSRRSPEPTNTANSARSRDAYLRFFRHVHHQGRHPRDDSTELAEVLTTDDIRAYLLHLLDDGDSWPVVNQTQSAIIFLYRHVLGREQVIEPLQRPFPEKPLPTVLNRAEVQRLLAAPTNLKHRAILALTYCGGLRVSEAVRLRPVDVDSERMLIHVKGQPRSGGKRRKDRYTLLSHAALETLRAYWRQYFIVSPAERRPVNRLGVLQTGWRWKMYDDFSYQGRLKEMLHDAERERLARRASAGRQARPGLFRQGRAWLERHLPGATNGVNYRRASRNLPV